MQVRLLLVEDDAVVRDAMASAMRAEGYEVDVVPTGESALEQFDPERTDLVLLDVRLPGISGHDVCRSMRDRSDVPVIMVTAQDDSHDVVAGLEAGADDYVTKPVDPKTLAARIRALLRRMQMNRAPVSTVRVGDLEIRELEGVVLRDGVAIPLTRTEFRLLCEFAAHAGQVLSREQLLERVWGYGYFGDSRLVDSHVRRLRIKIEQSPDEPELLLTVRGLGYKLARS
jgi:two-component system response regulator MtrA